MSDDAHFMSSSQNVRTKMQPVVPTIGLKAQKLIQSSAIWASQTVYCFCGLSSLYSETTFLCNAAKDTELEPPSLAMQWHTVPDCI